MSENTKGSAAETVATPGGDVRSTVHTDGKAVQIQRVSTMSSSLSDISAQTQAESAASPQPNLSIQTTDSPLTPFEEQSEESLPSPILDEPQVAEPDPLSSSPFRSATIEIVSRSTTSSAFAESFGLSISDQGKWIVAYSSAALYILLADDLPYFRKRACRAFRLRRKPLAVAITDIGYFAVLTNSFKIDVYKCGDGSTSSSISAPMERLQTVVLNNEAKAIALSPQGDLVAAGSDQGVEIVALGVEQGSSSDRRQINCGCALDWISFSDDGKSLLGTGPAGVARGWPTSVLLSISGGFDQGFEEDEQQPQQPIPKLWISQLIFPEKLQAGQAAFLPDRSAGSGAANEEVLAFNVRSERFGIFDTALKQFNGKSLGFPEEVTWQSLDKYENVLPGVSSDGINVALVVTLKGEQRGPEIWTYEIESNWREEELPPLSAGSVPGAQSQSNLIANQRLQLPRADDDAPTDLVSCLRWSLFKDEDSSFDSKRLIVLLHTVAVNVPEELAIDAPGVSARIMLFNITDSDSNIERDDENHCKVVINLDEFPLTEDLTVEDLALEREVDIVRRRTQVQRSLPRSSTTLNQPQLHDRNNMPRRSVTSSVVRVNNGPRNPGVITQASFPLPSDLRGRGPVNENTDNVSTASSPLDPSVNGAAADEPYSNQAPRSQFTLQRAATVAQNSPAGRMHLRSLPNRPLEYRPANGSQRQSGPDGIPVAGPGDVDDGWVPPPPPYSERPDNVASLPIEAIPGIADAVLRGQLLVGQMQQQAEGARMRARVSRVVTVPIPVPVPAQPVEPTPVAVPTPVANTMPSGQSATVSRRPVTSQPERAATLQIPQSRQSQLSQSPSLATPAAGFPSSAPITPVDIRRSRISPYSPSQASLSAASIPVDSLRPIIQQSPNLTRQQQAQQLAEQHYADILSRRRQQNGNASAIRISSMDPLNRELPPLPSAGFTSSEADRANDLRRPVTDSTATNNNLHSQTHGHFNGRYGQHESRSLSRLDTSLSAPNTGRNAMIAEATGRRQQWWRLGGSNNNSRSRSWSALDHHNDDERYATGQWVEEEKERKCVIQ